MPNLKPIGILYLNEDTGKKVLYPIKAGKSLTVRQPELAKPGRIIRQPTPEETKEEEKEEFRHRDHSAGEVLERHRRREKAKLPKSPVR